MIINGAESGPLISRARNMVCEAFLESTATHLLFSDTDIVFQPNDVRFLLEARKPIVGALYYGILVGNLTSTFPVALSYQEGTLQSLDKAPDSLTRVDAVGMGLTLVRRDVIEALKPDHAENTPFAEMWYEDPRHPGTGRHHGEDRPGGAQAPAVHRHAVPSAVAIGTRTRDQGRARN